MLSLAVFKTAPRKGPGLIYSCTQAKSTHGIALPKLVSHTVLHCQPILQDALGASLRAGNTPDTQGDAVKPLLCYFTWSIRDRNNQNVIFMFTSTGAEEDWEPSAAQFGHSQPAPLLPSLQP